jgi:hypothetical protein
VGSVLASTVIRDVQAKDAAHSDGWTAAQKWALVVAADAANYKTGAMLCSMQTLADLAGVSERTMRAAIDRALDERRCVMDGYFHGKSRSLRFPNPKCIEPERASAPSDGEPEGASAPTDGEPESDPEGASDIPVVPVIPEQLNVTARSRDSVTTTAENDIRRVFGCWAHELRYTRRVTLTAKRRDAIAFRLRDSYTVEQLAQAIRNTEAATFDAFDERVTDLPHILHADRIDDAIADKIGVLGDDWTVSPFDPPNPKECRV